MTRVRLNVEKWAPRWFWMLIAIAFAGTMLSCKSESPTALDVTRDIGRERAEVALLPMPTQFRAVWATPDQAAVRAFQYGANLVILQIDSWNTPVTKERAEYLRGRGIGTFIFIEQCFSRPQPAWDGCWKQVEAWSLELKAAGILQGMHVTDEWAYRGWAQGTRDLAVTYVRAHGFLVLNTEWIDAVKHPDYRRPPGEWFGVACYDWGGIGHNYPKGVAWHLDNCAGEYERHLEWNIVVAQGFDAGNGMPDPARWEKVAEGRSIAWWIDAN